MDYLTLKALHFISIVAWFAGLFYLPRLFVYHTQIQEPQTYALFCLMEWRLFHIIMIPAALSTFTTGAMLLYLLPPNYGLKAPHFHAKAFCLFLLYSYFFRCYLHLKDFEKQNNNHSERYFRIYNEIPTVLLCCIVFLIIFKPFASS